MTVEPGVSWEFPKSLEEAISRAQKAPGEDGGQICWLPRGCIGLFVSQQVYVFPTTLWAATSHGLGNHTALNTAGDRRRDRTAGGIESEANAWTN
jgi:hypothetical protein